VGANLKCLQRYLDVLVELARILDMFQQLREPRGVWLSS